MSGELQSQSMAKGFLGLLKDKHEQEAKLKELNAQIFATQQELYDRMEAEDVDSIEIEGIKFSPSNEIDFQIDDPSVPVGMKWDDYEPFFKWLKDRGDGALIKTRESVQWNTRKKYLKELYEAGEPLPSWVKDVHAQTIKYNKSAVKRLMNE